MAAPTTAKPFWLTTTEAEAAHNRVLGGEIVSKGKRIPIKVAMNDTDVRQPRLVIRCPCEDFVGKQMYQLDFIYLLFVQSILLPAINKVAITLFGAKLVNFRAEGNVALRPNSTEPITPHWHAVLRVNDKEFKDPFVGSDYPLATEKVHLKDSALTTEFMAEYSHKFSQALLAEITERLADPEVVALGLLIVNNLISY